MGGGLENRYVGRVCGTDGAVVAPIQKLAAENRMLQLNI